MAVVIAAMASAVAGWLLQGHPLRDALTLALTVARWEGRVEAAVWVTIFWLAVFLFVAVFAKRR